MGEEELSLRGDVEKEEDFNENLKDINCLPIEECKLRLLRMMNSNPTKLACSFPRLGFIFTLTKNSQNCLHLQILNKSLTLKLHDWFKPLLLWHVPITLQQRSTPQSVSASHF